MCGYFADIGCFSGIAIRGSSRMGGRAPIRDRRIVARGIAILNFHKNYVEIKDAFTVLSEICFNATG